MILMVDEEKRRMSTFKDYLEDEGYIVVFINDIHEAYVYVEQNHSQIQALILDIMMPWGDLFTREETGSGVLTGIRFYKKVRAAWLPETPVIIYTAVNRSHLSKAMLDEENCSFIGKPDPPSKVVRRLKQFGVLPETE